VRWLLLAVRKLLSVQCICLCPGYAAVMHLIIMSRICIVCVSANCLISLLKHTELLNICSGSQLVRSTASVSADILQDTRTQLLGCIDRMHEMLTILTYVTVSVSLSVCHTQLKSAAARAVYVGSFGAEHSSVCKLFYTVVTHTHTRCSVIGELLHRRRHTR